MKIKLIKSTIGATPKHVKIVKALGLRKIGQVKEVPDNAAIRGAIAKVSHLTREVK
jgi:large subunit ribosomal protein L30